MVFEEVSFLFGKYVEEWLNRNTVYFIGAIVAQLTSCIPLVGFIWAAWTRIADYS